MADTMTDTIYPVCLAAAIIVVAIVLADIIRALTYTPPIDPPLPTASYTPPSDGDESMGSNHNAQHQAAIRKAEQDEARARIYTKVLNERLRDAIERMNDDDTK